MRRGLAGAACAAALVAVVLPGCGEDEGFSDGRITEAVGIEDGAVGGDPFCVVTGYLNDADEVEEAEGKDTLVITSSQGNAGVEVEPPFPPDCEKQVQKGLDKLDKPEE